ncbi:scabin-related ADP-ribosyltransferase [Actinomadura luteofluorescens]
MGVEHPTRTDTKVETDDQPGPPGQRSRPEGRATAQQPDEPGTDQKGEKPTPARSARAENSNDPNDDPNRIGTPRADSLAIARGEKPQPPDEKQDVETTAGRPEPYAERPPGTSGTPRADSMAIARGEKLETGENEAGAPETDPPGTPKERPDGAEPPADDNREPDNAAQAPPGEQPLGEQDTEASKQDTPSRPKLQEDQPPAPQTSRTDEPGDVTPEPDDGTGQTPPPDGQPLDHGILDNRAEDVERPAETNPSKVADGKLPAETGEQLGEAPPAPEPEPDAEASPAPTDGEPPVQPEHGAIEEPEPPTGVQDHSGPEPKESKDDPAQEPADEGTDGSGDGEPDHGKKAEGEAVPRVPEKAKEPFAHSATDKDLDPIAAGAPDSQSKDGDKGRDGDQEKTRSQDDPLEKYKRAVKNPQRVFRGDTRSPDDIFVNGDGFRARGTSNDLKRYAELNEPSRFIGTSMTEDAAKPFTVAVQGSKRKLHGWVYEIESPAPAINVNKALGLRYRLVLWGQSEKEMAYLDHIPREHIKRAREVKGLSYTGKVVENPHFEGR